MSEISFALEDVLEDARQKAGLDDFGGDDFKEGLQKLLTTYDANGYDEKGRKRCRRRVVELLSARLRIAAAFERHPDIRDVEIKRPMYLTGLPRTGTSALLNLLAADPAARPLKLWEGMNPDPIEGLKAGEEDPRYLMMKQYYDSMNEKSDFKKIHHTTADTPEECIHLLNHTFQDVQYGVETMMEPYASWFQQHNKRDSYYYYADLLKMLQWQRPGERWLLKSPCHLWALDTLVEMFPDCSIIITHRNPLECITSYASMMAALMPGRKDLDKTQLGPVVMEYLARKLEASLLARENFGAERVIDIQFNDFLDNPLAMANKIYQHFDLPMENEAKAAIENYAAEHPMGKHGKHEYDLGEYGLNEAQILKRFGFYIDRFEIPMD